MWVQFDDVPCGMTFIYAGIAFEKIGPLWGSSAQCPIYRPTIVDRNDGYVFVGA